MALEMKCPIKAFKALFFFFIPIAEILKAFQTNGFPKLEY